MVRLELTRPTLAENLALDEALLLDAATGGPAVLRFWHWPSYAVVVGAGGKLSDEVDLERCAADRVEVARRGSGGGTVLLGPGCLLYSLVLPMTAHPALIDLNASYRHIMGRTAAALAAGVTWNGISDLVYNDRKFSGNAQQRKRGCLLHHGTLLHSFDLPMIERYLRQPPRMPDYRRDRTHAEFVGNLPIGVERLKEILSVAWGTYEEALAWPRDSTAQLVEKKYGSDDWIMRR